MSSRLRFGVVVLAGLFLLGGLLALIRRTDSRATYQPILGLYNTGFFVEYEQARRQGARWVTHDREVATRFVQAVEYCPGRSVRRLPTEPGQAVWIIEDTCVAGMFTIKNRRIDLVQEQGQWTVVWAGVKFKCAYTSNDLGNQLLMRNPFRQSRFAVLINVNQTLQALAPRLNLWRTICP
jgi:hypothetical protein